MRILYGVVGEGMGHATRSRVTLDHLLTRGHQIQVVVSDRAYGFLSGLYADDDRIDVTEIAGLHLAYRENAVDVGKTIRETLEKAPASLRRNVVAARQVMAGFEPEMIFTDFDSFAYLLGKTHRVPVVSIDNIQVVHRCAHDPRLTDEDCGSFRLAKAAVKLRLPGAYHYLVSSLFFPPVRKHRTTLVPPILRPEVLAAVREPGEHVLVYQTAATNTALVPALKKLPFEFRVYGMGRDGSDGNVHFRPFSQVGFVDDLRTARAVIAGGGYSLMSETVHLRVPCLSIPLEKQWEQQLNARYLTELGYGAWAPEASGTVIRKFLDRLEDFDAALATYEPRDNAILRACVDELVARVEAGEPPPDRLESPALGSWQPE